MVSKWPSMERRGPVITESDVVAFEKRLGHSLPEDYRRFLLEVNGGYPASSHASYAYGAINSLFSLNDTIDANDLLQRHIYNGWLPSLDLLCIGYDDGAHIHIAITGEHRGEIWLQNIANPRPTDSNPRVYWFDRRDMKKLADSFEQFVGTLKPL
jgi:hypothetical protein